VAESRTSEPQSTERQLLSPAAPDEPPTLYWRRLQREIAARRDARIEAARSIEERSEAIFDALIETMNASRDVVLLAIDEWKRASSKSPPG
jgi:hypothetical protein